MRIVIPLILFFGIILICAKVDSIDAISVGKGKAGQGGKIGGSTKTGKLAEREKTTSNKVDSFLDSLKYGKPTPREFISKFSNSIDKFNSDIHSDLLRLITNFVIGLVKFV